MLAPSAASGQPTLRELTQRLLQSPTSAPFAGEVEPYHQGLPHQWIDPLLLWPDAVAAAALLLPADEAAAFQPAKLKMPSAWAKRLGETESQRLVPLAVGQAPAQLRDLTPLLNEGPSALRKAAAPASANGSAPLGETRLTLAQRLASAALDRLDGRFAAAAAKLEAIIAEAPESWRSLLENESAALLWAKGEHAEAELLWNESASAFSPVFQFNRALAALRRGDLPTAAPLLKNAAAAFPAVGGWHHLAQLYLTLIETA